MAGADDDAVKAGAAAAAPANDEQVRERERERDRDREREREPVRDRDSSRDLPLREVPREPTPPREPAPPREYRDPRDDRDSIPETLRQRLESLVPELVKKTFAAGMGAVFSTEEGIRKIARENLPEVAGYLASSADTAKDKVFEVIARETREFLSNLNLTEEIAKILTTLSFEIKTEIRFIPNSERITGAEPDVKASVRLKRNDAGRPAPPTTPPGREAERDRRDGPRDDFHVEDEGQRDSRSRLRFWRRGETGADEDEDEGHDK